MCQTVTNDHAKMAMSSIPCIEENQLGIKVQGDLADFQIVEEDSESEDDNRNGQDASNTLSTLPQDLMKTSMVPVFGSVQVTKSENVHFGNNTYFNGPITIKQVVHSKEQDNCGYEHDEDDPDSHTPVPARKAGATPTQLDTAQVKSLQLQLWLKLTFAVVCVILVVGICAIAYVTLLNTTQEDTSTYYNDYSSSNSTECVSILHKMVEGLFHNYKNLTVIFTLVFLVLITYSIWFCELLTRDVYCSGDKTTKSQRKDHTMPKKDNSQYNIEADPLLIAPTHLRIVSRTDWLAQPVEKPLDKIRLPVPWVIIQHTATEDCHTQSECVLKVRLIQMFHVESRGWYDIGYNFLVAGDGSAYFGRGWEYQGAHTLGYNKYSMGIAFIGTFNNDPPPKKQLDACKKLIQRGVELGKIAKDYKLFAHRQLASTLSPGDKLFDILKEWPHFVKNFTDIEELIPNY